MNKTGVYSKVLKRIVFAIMVILLLTVLIPVTVGIYYFNKADFKCPNDSIYPEKYHVKSVGDSIKYIEYDLLHRNKYGLWEVTKAWRNVLVVPLAECYSFVSRYNRPA